MSKFNYENKRLLDVVDENDKVISSKSRIDIHRLGLMHRDIHIWMFDKNQNIFFQKRGLDRHLAGLFDATVGGHLDKGETYLAAAIRETKEETGLQINAKDLILIKKFKSFYRPTKNDSLGITNNCFRCLYLYKKPIKKEQLKKEVGVLGVDFKRFSKNFLLHLDKKNKKLFDEDVLVHEIPHVLKYLNDLP